jgi:hypothetical protein
MIMAQRSCADNNVSMSAAPAKAAEVGGPVGASMAIDVRARPEELS